MATWQSNGLTPHASDSSYSINLRAGYLRTWAATVKGGPANASVTFTFGFD